MSADLVHRLHCLGMGVAADMLARPSLSLLSEPYAVAVLDLLVSRIERDADSLRRAGQGIAALRCVCGHHHSNGSCLPRGSR